MVILDLAFAGLFFLAGGQAGLQPLRARGNIVKTARRGIEIAELRNEIFYDRFLLIKATGCEALNPIKEGEPIRE